MKTVGIPLILTFKLDAQSQARLDAWRQRYFPPERNYLKAHLTIYHQLPGQQIETIREILRSHASSESIVPIEFTNLKSRQGFVGVEVSSPLLGQIKGRLDQEFREVLRAQDKQGYRPHITVTNLGSPKEAEKCFRELETIFEAWTGQVIGLELYHYRSGPWEFAEMFPFTPLA